MTTAINHAPWSNRALLSTAAVFVLVYALAGAWIVATNGEEPPALSLERTDDGVGIVITGAVPDEPQRQALVAAVGEVTGAAVVIADVTIDPDAEPIDPALTTANELAAALPPDPGS